MIGSDAAQGETRAGGGPRLTPETRLAVLRIKDAWFRRPEYRSTVRGYDIYEAVLDHGVRTERDFEAYLSRRADRI